MHELINKRFSGVTFDSFSSSFSDYSNVSSHLTDVLNEYLGFGCSRQISKKITYEYTIKYFSYKKLHDSHRGKSAITICNDKSRGCFCSKGAENQVVSNASDDASDPFAPLSETKFLDALSKRSSSNK